MAETPRRIGHPLLLLTAGRFRQFVREPSAVFWTFGFPILLTVALGLAFRHQRPAAQPVAVVGDADGRLQLALDGGSLSLRSLAEDQALLGLRRSELTLVVRRGADDLLEYVYDPQRPESQLARATADDLLQRARGGASPLLTRDVPVEAAGARYIDWLVPGLLGQQLMSGSLWGIAFVIVESRQKKLLKRLIATPMRRRDFLASFVLWRLLFVAVEIPLLLAFSFFAFAVPVRGSLWLVALLSVVGAAAFAGIGLLCGCRAKNTETANGLVNLVQLPMFLLSGVFFSSARFPAWAQLPIRLLPLTALNDGLRAVINDGRGVEDLGFPLAVLLAWGAISGLLALRIFRWT